MNKEANRYKEDIPPGDNNTTQDSMPTGVGKNKVRFEIFGEEMVEKTVQVSGNSGRAYIPPQWLGHKVKIIRID